MSSKNKSFLTFIQDKMKEYEEIHGSLGETHRNFILLGVEFDNEDFPEIMMNRAVNNYATQIAGLDILRDMIEEDYDKLKEKLHKARNRGYSKSETPGTPPIPNAEQLMQSLRDRLLRMAKDAKTEKKAPEPKQEDTTHSDEVMNQLKAQFGFDGSATELKDGFSIQSSKPDNDDDDDE